MFADPSLRFDSFIAREHTGAEADPPRTTSARAHRETIEITRGGAPIAFAIAGLVALLTSYSYLELTLRFPGEGGTVEFLNRAFGGGIVTGAANILLLLSYVVLLSVYAYAFGSYGAGFFPAAEREFWLHVLITGVIVGLVLLSVFGTDLVGIRSTNRVPDTPNRLRESRRRCQPSWPSVI